jgi:diguanylate cyclase (GGDEF)-like protein
MKEHLYIIKRLKSKIKLIQDKKLKVKIKNLLKDLESSISKIYIQAITEPKTGLYNNYFFETMLEMELEKTKRGNEKFCLLIVDLDFFKKINDTYGHIKGDDILKRFATLLGKNTRKFDIIARFGGEEFIILFPGADIHLAKSLTERFKEEVKKDIFLEKYKVTFSGGLTQAKKDDTSQKIKLRVDGALYEAKNQGRDKFIIIE